jgi:hypothetical protein
MVICCGFGQYSSLNVKPQEKKPFGEPRSRCEDDTEVDYESMN